MTQSRNNLRNRKFRYDKYQMYVNRFVMLGQELGAEQITMHSWFDPRTFTTTMRAACEVDGAVYTGSYGYTDGELVDAYNPELFVAISIMTALRKAYQASGIWSKEPWKVCPDCDGLGLSQLVDDEACEMCDGEGGWRE